jgi:NTP pyrophosphatase (non-canonical NTP hydrolase)
MRTAAECLNQAEECRRLAKLHNKTEDWAAFLEMAESWEILAKQRQERLRSKTTALADRFRDVLSLSDTISSSQIPLVAIETRK